MAKQSGPLRVYCRNCGAPARFDIIHQTYRCGYCGTETGIQEEKQSLAEWRTLHKNSRKKKYAGREVYRYSCPTCGAQLVFESGEASGVCPFCGTSTVRRDLVTAEQLPELLIPFYITPEEARQRLDAWARRHCLSHEGRKILSSEHELKGYYLPFQIVRGPAKGIVSRDSSSRRFRLNTYMSVTAVNTSAQLDNAVLNAAEPFDWSAAVPFEPGYIAGQNVKLSDLSNSETRDRVTQEVTDALLPDIERDMQTTGIRFDLIPGDLMSMPALLPFYFIKEGNLTAVVNGQTGRVAASTGRVRKTVPWVIEPAVYTAVLTLILGSFYDFAPEMLLIFGTVFALIIFSILGDGRTSLIRSIIMRGKRSRAEREGNEVHFTDAADEISGPQYVFMEDDGKGNSVPVTIKFFTPGRVLSVIFNCLFTISLPLIIASVMRLASMGPGERFLDHFEPLYGAAWYTLAFFIVLIYLLKGVRKDAYDHPILYSESREGKRKRKIGRHSSRRLTVLSTFGFGPYDENGNRYTFKEKLWFLGKTGVWIILGFLALLLGSSAAIVF